MRSFMTPEVEFLGIIVENLYIQIIPEKAKVVEDWPIILSLVPDIECFLGLASFSRGFSTNFSRIIWQLTELSEESIPLEQERKL